MQCCPPHRIGFSCACFCKRAVRITRRTTQNWVSGFPTWWPAVLFPSFVNFFYNLNKKMGEENSRTIIAKFPPKHIKSFPSPYSSIYHTSCSIIIPPKKCEIAFLSLSFTRTIIYTHAYVIREVFSIHICLAHTHNTYICTLCVYDVIYPLSLFIVISFFVRRWWL